MQELIMNHPFVTLNKEGDEVILLYLEKGWYVWPVYYINFLEY